MPRTSLDSSRSLKTLPNPSRGLPDPNDGLGGYGLPSTIRSIQKTGFRRWGFRIYRCTYDDDDDDAWDRYVGNLEHRLQKGLKATGSDYMLAPYHEWTIVEDREALDGAAKGEVRSRFRRWREARSVQRDGPGADHELIGLIGLVARFEACIMVDEECLDSMEKNKGKANRFEPYFVVIGHQGLPLRRSWRSSEKLGMRSYVVLYDELCGMGPWWRRRQDPPDIYPYI
ncbi:hypothetical protein INS49_005763 [Diaporthe citri]|uniref:uncharacterized protein n=1 Tax=Diaporthe citri TaxID=83186 RepID=UPI001C813E28|nr:uncharacterized protein INS49_005763 [Diaporthe citri]KAG6364165.1 hypothetical protein INS49_005763 [Diaporthe citri]